MRYGSVCSGIEAASVAWAPLGWKPSFFSEIEAHPRSILKHRHPDVPLHGDFTTIKAGEYDAIDLLVGGTPCQDFSVAGLRAGLDGDRGNLTLEFGRLARRLRPRWLLWENVPGVLSNNGGRDFATVLGLFSGRTVPVPKRGWQNAGIIPGYGNAYGLAYRVLDAQFVRVDGYARAVPQRRRRVFVVGYIGDWRRAAAVLFERESLSGDPAPRRRTREDVAGALSASAGRRGGVDDPERGKLVAQAFGGNNTAGAIDVAAALLAQPGSGYKGDFDSETFVAHSLRGEGFDASEDGTGRGTPLVAVATALRARDQAKGVDSDCTDTLVPLRQPIPFDTTQITHPENRSRPQPGAPCHALAKAGHPPAITFHGAQDPDVSGDVTHPVGRNGGLETCIAFGIRSDATREGTAKTPSADAEGRVRLRAPGMGVYAQLSPTLDASQPHSVAFGVSIRGREGGATAEVGDDVGMALRASQGGGDKAHALIGHNGGPPLDRLRWAVRRLTPLECERLQGFPDGWTLVPVGKRGKMMADGPRYRALGNSMAVNVMSWLGRRIDLVDSLYSTGATNADTSAAHVAA